MITVKTTRLSTYSQHISRVQCLISVTTVGPKSHINAPSSVMPIFDSVADPSTTLNSTLKNEPIWPNCIPLLVKQQI